MDRNTITDNLFWVTYSIFKQPNKEDLYSNDNLPENKYSNNDLNIGEEFVEGVFNKLFLFEWVLEQEDFDLKTIRDFKPFSREDVLYYLKIEYDWYMKRIIYSHLEEDYKLFKKRMTLSS